MKTSLAAAAAAALVLAVPALAIADPLSLPKLGLTIEAEAGWEVWLNPWGDVELVRLGDRGEVLLQVDQDACAPNDPGITIRCPDGFACGFGTIGTVTVTTMCTAVGGKFVRASSTQQSFDLPGGTEAVVLAAQRTRDAVAAGPGRSERGPTSIGDTSDVDLGRLYLGLVHLSPSDPSEASRQGARVGMEFAMDPGSGGGFTRLTGFGAAIGFDSAGHLLFDSRVSGGFGFRVVTVDIGAVFTVGIDRLGPDFGCCWNFDPYGGGEILTRIPIGALQLDGAVMVATSQVRWWAALSRKFGKDIIGLGVEQIYMHADIVEGEFADSMTSVFIGSMAP